MGRLGDWGYAGSLHPGGANRVQADGSMRFVSENTTASLLDQVGRMADGKTPSWSESRVRFAGRNDSAPAIASLRSSRLFIHSLLAGRGKSPPDVFPQTKTSGFHGCYAPGIASLRSSRLFLHSLLSPKPASRLPAGRGLTEAASRVRMGGIVTSAGGDQVLEAPFFGCLSMKRRSGG